MKDQLIAALEPLVRRVRTDATAIRGANGVVWTRDELTPARLAKHLNGGPARGVCPIKAGESTTMVGVLDLDSHKGESTWLEMTEVAEQVIEALAAKGMRANPWRSGGGNGVHLIVMWDEPQDAHSVRQALIGTLVDLGYTNGTGGVAKKQIEVFPKQASVPAGGFGNQFFLPLGGKSEPLVPELGLAPGGRQEAVGYEWRVSEPVPVVERASATQATSYSVEDASMLERALFAIPNDIESRDDWFRLMCAFKDGGGDKEAARAWTAQHTGHDDDKFDGPWDSITVGKEGGATADYLFNVAKARGGFGEHIVSEFPDESAAAPTDAGPAKFVFEPVHSFASATSLEWWVKQVLPKAGLAVLYGASGAGKSFVMLDMAMSIARGVAWREKRVRQGRVAYIAAEGSAGFRKRVAAYAQHNEVDLTQVPMVVLNAAPNLMDAKDSAAVAAAIATSGGADVIVVDTLAQTTPGGNENASEDMGRAVAHCKRIHEVTGALVVLVHHSGKDQARGARGWSGIRAACDAEIEVVRTEAGARYLRLSKSKDDEDGMEWGFDLHQVQLGVDEDLDPITSCVVREAVVNKAKSIGKVLGPNETIVNQVIQEMAKVQTAGIEAEAILAEAIRLMSEPDEGKRDTRRQHAKRALKSLCEGDTAPYEMGDDGCVSVL